MQHTEQILLPQPSSAVWRMAERWPDQIYWLINLKGKSAYLKTYNSAKVLRHDAACDAKSPVHQQAQAGAQTYVNRPFIFSVP